MTSLHCCFASCTDHGALIGQDLAPWKWKGANRLGEGDGETEKGEETEEEIEDIDSNRVDRSVIVSRRDRSIDCWIDPCICLFVCMCECMCECIDR